MLGQDLLTSSCGTEWIRLSQHAPISYNLVNNRIFLTTWPTDSLMLIEIFTAIDWADWCGRLASMWLFILMLLGPETDNCRALRAGFRDWTCGRILARRTTLFYALEQVHVELAVLYFALVSCLEETQVGRNRWGFVSVQSLRRLIDPFLDVGARFPLRYQPCMHFLLLLLAEVLFLHGFGHFLVAKLVNINVKAWFLHNLGWLHL